MKYPNDKFTSAACSEPSERAQRASGSATPRDVIRGESLNTPHTNQIESPAKNLAFIDYLSFTHRPTEPIAEKFPLRSLLIETFGLPDYGLILWVYRKSLITLDQAGKIFKKPSLKT